jgi:glycogen synthase
MRDAMQKPRGGNQSLQQDQSQTPSQASVRPIARGIAAPKPSSDRVTPAPGVAPSRAALVETEVSPPNTNGHEPHASKPRTPDHSHYTEPPVLFEVGWEVCWQLGGIYTVLKTKAAAMKQRWDQRYFLIGPYNPATAAAEFEAGPPPPVVERVFDALREQGIACHFGRWLVPGRPNVILLDYRGRYSRMHEDKYLMHADHHISLPPDDGEVNDVVAFGFTVAEFFRILVEQLPSASIIAHFHEWMAGVAVPRIAHLRLPIATVFTTHATLLGRYLAGDNPAFYDHLPFFNADAEADKYRILPRHQIEKAASHASTVFTTVSQVTSFEAEKLLGRVPDAILPNGIDVKRFEAPHEMQHFHGQYKERIHQFTMGHFWPSYHFDLDKTLYFFTAGRYEYKNKGLDLYIEALWRLNRRLQQEKDPPTIVAFVIARGAVKNVNVDVLENQARLDELARYCDEIKHEIGKRIFTATASGRQPGRGDLIDENVQINLRRLAAAFKRFKQPHIVTHDLMDDARDPVMNHLRHRHLLNGSGDPVKVVFHPQFATATSPLLGLDYDEFIRGCHLGVFPSYYEPWGYTPMECIVSGIPAVTSDLSGFGSYVQGTMSLMPDDGLKVINRRYRGFDDSADELAEFMFHFVKLSRRERINMRNKAESLSGAFDWQTLASHYHDAHDLALSRTGKKSGSITVKFA